MPSFALVVYRDGQDRWPYYQCTFRHQLLAEQSAALWRRHGYYAFVRAS